MFHTCVSCDARLIPSFGVRPASGWTRHERGVRQDVSRDAGVGDPGMGMIFSQKHRRCLGSRLGDYGRSEIECQDPVDGRWTGCGRAGAAEIAWEEARDGGARSKVRIWWTGGGRAVDGRELQK